MVFMGVSCPTPTHPDSASIKAQTSDNAKALQSWDEADAADSAGKCPLNGKSMGNYVL